MAKEKQTVSHPLSRAVFFVYCMVMLWLLFGQRLDGWDQGREYLDRLRENINLNPFETIRLFWRVTENSANTYLVRHAFFNLAGNVVMFAPLGYFLPRLWKPMRGLFRTLLCAAGIILLIELLQLFTLLGSCDIDDLLLNLIGAAVGYLFWRINNK